VSLGDGLVGVGRPVAVTPDDGKVDAALGELDLDRRLELAVLRVDGADTAERTVVVGDLFEALLR
jgi:hypothetical protein